MNGSTFRNDDECYQLRGVLVPLVKDGSRLPELHEAFSISLNGREGTYENDLVFIVPRNDNTLIVTGDCPQFKQALDWHAEFYPSLKYSESDSERTVPVGTQPFRETNACCHLHWRERWHFPQ